MHSDDIAVAMDDDFGHRETERLRRSDGLSSRWRSSRVLVSSRLSPRDQALLATVNRFRQATALQLVALHFNDTKPSARKSNASRALSRLVAWGQLARIERAVGGYAGGSTGFIYQPVGSRARSADLHTLDILGLYCALTEAARLGWCEVLAYEPEAYAYTRVGHSELRPDAYARIKTAGGIDQYFIEVDAGSEYKSQLMKKMRAYTSAFDKWTEPTFPLVVWTVPDSARKQFVESVVRQQQYPALHKVVIFNDAVDFLTQKS